MEIEAELLKDAGFLLDRAMNGKIAVEKVEKFRPILRSGVNGYSDAGNGRLSVPCGHPESGEGKKRTCG